MPGTVYRGRDLINFYLQGAPTATLVENFPRDQISTDLVASLVTQVMTSVPILLQSGDIVTNLSFLSGATAAGTPVNWWFALYSNAATPALLGQTASQGAGAWAADTLKTVPLASPITITSTGIYYAAVMVQATVVPTLMGKTLGRSSAAAALVAGMSVLAQNSGSALTTTAPATIATPTAQATIPYCIVT